MILRRRFELSFGVQSYRFYHSVLLFPIELNTYYCYICPILCATEDESEGNYREYH
jgi:hypothetical protein